MSTVNGVAALTAATREGVGVDITNGLMDSEVFRARVLLDAATTFTIDDPNVGSISGATNNRVFIVGLEFCADFNSTVVFYSKLGSNTARQLAKYKLAANSGIILPISNQFLSPTDPGAVLQVSASGASGGDPMEMLVHYVFADTIRLSSHGR